MTPPRIGITLGDPGGIGPEVVLKSLSALSSLPESQFVLFGSRNLIDYEGQALKLDFSFSPGSVTLNDIQGPPDPVEKGNPNPINGSLSFRYFEQAVQEAREGKIQAIVTAPISKRSWDLAGVHWAGHTHLLSSFYPDAIMFFWSQNLKVALYTHHIPLRQAVEKVQEKPLLEFILRLHEYLNAIPGQDFALLIAGLNPHAGEQGLMGSEESEHILPAVAEARSKGIPISGPIPPDVVFRQASGDPDKIVIALFHDQGLIPFKLQAFAQGVNLTLGLPFVRTSPDHGTAFDIAGKNIADPTSMMEAIRLAHRFTTR
jgi:4-hydroxythreonine-4-phosphate dehydrogenase